jgi:glycine C-acetyltransferase
MASVRFICGTQDIHKTLEKNISEFHKLDDTILYPSCFDANAGLFEAILTDEDAVISDSLNHASIIDGIRLCKAKRQRYKHMDLHDLEEQLKQSMDKRMRLIVTDGVFSMDGDIAPLPEIVALAKKYDAYTFIDECHGTGVFGKGGKGTPEYFGLEGEIDIINSTLGKALGGGTGGYTSASQEVVDVLRQKGRPYLFSNSIAPSVVGATNEVFKMLGESQDMIANLHANTALFRSKMKAAGFNVLGHDDCPIAPVYLGDAKVSGEMSNRLMERYNIFVIGFSFPVVPKGQARIRCQLSGAHTKE